MNNVKFFVTADIRNRVLRVSKSTLKGLSNLASPEASMYFEYIKKYPTYKIEIV